MAWVERNGCRYWYRSVRRGGRVAREYGGRGPVAALAAELFALERERAALAAADERAALAEYRERLDRIERAAAEADELLRTGAALLLGLDGYHRPRRGRWRKRRATTMGAGLKKTKRDFAKVIESLKREGDYPEPRRQALLEYRAPASDPAAV